MEGAFWWRGRFGVGDVAGRRGMSTFHRHKAVLESLKQCLGEGQSGEKVDTEFRCLWEKSGAQS